MAAVDRMIRAGSNGRPMPACSMCMSHAHQNTCMCVRTEPARSSARVVRVNSHMHQSPVLTPPLPSLLHTHRPCPTQARLPSTRHHQKQQQAIATTSRSSSSGQSINHGGPLPGVLEQPVPYRPDGGVGLLQLLALVLGARPRLRAAHLPLRLPLRLLLPVRAAVCLVTRDTTPLYTHIYIHT